MAIFSSLPVYKTSYDLLVNLFVATKDFAKDYKYTLGENIKKEALEMIANVYRANSTERKAPFIQKARENAEVVRLYLRLVKDLKQINLKRFVQLNEAIESVSKQLTAWQKYANNF